MVAYYTAMRQGEILNLTWGQVDLKEGFIHLRPEDTKTNEGSDLVRVPWNDLVADGLSLPLRKGSLDAIVALDFVHHVARPGRLFEEAARVLRPGGRVSMVEPWVTPLSYPVYRFLHEEGCRLSLDPWNPFPAARSADKEPFEGDGAVPFRLVRDTPPSRWAALGFSPILIHYVLMFLVSLTAVSSFEAVGSVLVVAFMIAPPAAAYLLTDRLPVMLIVAILIGVVSSVAAPGC